MTSIASPGIPDDDLPSSDHLSADFEPYLKDMDPTTLSPIRALGGS